MTLAAAETATPQDPSPSLEARVRAMRPVFVIAPTARNGITLVQRLLNSSGRIIVYGENPTLLQTLPALAVGGLQMHQQTGPELDAARSRFLAGETDGWTSNLWPDSGRFVAVLCEALYRTALVYQQCSAEYGFERWGVKNPLSDPYIIPRLLSFMPNARFVFLHRHLFDVARSAKARRFITNDAQLAEYGRLYQQNMHAVLNTPRPQLMVVRYEDLTARPGEQIEHLERFVGVTGIDRSVMGRRINTFTGPESRGHSPDGYIPPTDLTDHEKHLLLHHARPTLAQAGYDVT